MNDIGVDKHRREQREIFAVPDRIHPGSAEMPYCVPKRSRHLIRREVGRSDNNAEAAKQIGYQRSLSGGVGVPGRWLRIVISIRHW